MNNYISVGCDALVTLNFHRQRNSQFFANRIFNKVKKNCIFFGDLLVIKIFLQYFM